MEKYSDQQLRTMVAQARAIAAHASDADIKAAFAEIADRLDKTRSAIPVGVLETAPELLIAAAPIDKSSP